LKIIITLFVMSFFGGIFKMIDTQSQQQTQSLEEVLNIFHNQEKTLFSYTEKLPHAVDPIELFSSFKQYKGNRMFWSSPDDSFIYVGLGEAKKIICEENRFQAIEEVWRKLINESIIHNPYSLPGTGPVLFGGFSFDPEEKSSLWSNFPNSRMILPKYSLVIKDDATYLTINILSDQQMSVSEIVYSYEHLKNSLFALDFEPSSPNLTHVEALKSREWLETIEHAKKLINNNELSKVVLARELVAAFDEPIDTSTVLYNLLEQQKQSYVYAIESGEDCFIGATPERLIKVESNRLFTTCLAGTAPRGETLMEDERIEKELLQDQKNLEEHQFVVQTIKEAIDTCSFDIEMPNSPTVMKLKNLQHLYTPIEATLKEGYSILNLVEKLHPTPAMGGVPREKALQFIHHFETLNRGWYAAPLGWIDSAGNGEFVVGIRSGLIQGKKASLFAGCGIVKDSNPDTEFLETDIKFKPMLMALGGAK
jgi:menaquinone-specific isochorismate synthase